MLAARLLARGAGRGTVAIVVGLCAANPITLRALDIGHPEELLGAVLCAGAVLAAVRGRATLAGVLLGLAVANKAWALLASGPSCSPCRPIAPARAGDRRRDRRSPSCCRCCWPAPRAGSRARQRGTGAIFQPWQVWWFLGSTGELIRGADGLVKEGYRSVPAGSRRSATR